MREILQQVAEGTISIEDAVRRLRMHAVDELEGLANLDTSRSLRRGLPEIVRCHGKPVEDAVAMASAYLEAAGRTILSAATGEHRDLLAARYPTADLEFNDSAQLLVVKSKEYVRPTPHGVVCIVSAGTSDIPIGRQAEIIAREAGCTVHTWWDVGVAGIHRLFPAVRRLIEADCDVVIAVAGQEASLGPVLAGLVDIPVVGLPTSTGTGYGGEGEGALSTMLQACSMGISVVNIDNGIAAGTVAAAIAQRASRECRHASKTGV